MPFEVLNFALMLFGFFHRLEGAEIAAFAGGGVLFAGVEAVLSGFEFADHIRMEVRIC